MEHVRNSTHQNKQCLVIVNEILVGASGRLYPSPKKLGPPPMDDAINLDDTTDSPQPHSTASADTNNPIPGSIGVPPTAKMCGDSCPEDMKPAPTNTKEQVTSAAKSLFNELISVGHPDSIFLLSTMFTHLALNEPMYDLLVHL